jgi:hypothetical protein
MKTNGHTWKRACNFWSDIMKTERLSCKGMKHGSTTINLQANVKAWSGNTTTPRTKKFRRVPSAGKVMLMLF